MALMALIRNTWRKICKDTIEIAKEDDHFLRETVLTRIGSVSAPDGLDHQDHVKCDIADQQNA